MLESRHPRFAIWRRCQLASWMGRVASFLVDMVILNIAILPVLYLSAPAVFQELHTVRPYQNDEAGWYALVTWACYLAYAALLMSRQGEHNGQTLGKQIMRMRVVRDDGHDIDVGFTFFREVGGKFLNTLCFLGYFWPLIDGSNRGWHDMFAGSHVLVTNGQGQLKVKSESYGAAQKESAPLVVNQRTVAQMQVDEVAYVAQQALVLDSNRGCWVDSDAAVQHSADHWYAVEMRVNPDGGVHLRVPEHIAQAMQEATTPASHYQSQAFRPATHVTIV
jgi:uncharacterized RDD family membrane protein YckC